MNTTSKNLLLWYKKSNYYMPWRNQASPYQIWISEIMLQQTQVKTVLNYYNNWMEKFPTVKCIAEATIDDILKLWEGLGYYKRAHNIYDASKIIVNEYNGKVPNIYSDLIQLPGIGDYTASAILSIAFNKPYSAIDGNLKRVISRLNILDNKFKNIDIMKKFVIKLMKNNNPGDINQAFMDLGREVCVPRIPKCEICPLNVFCLAYIRNEVSLYPIKEIRKKIPSFDVVVGMIYKKNKFLISKRKKNGLLGGLWELPGGKKMINETDQNCLKREIKEELNITIDVINKIGYIKHQYSHFKINLIGYICQYSTGNPQPLAADDLRWISKKSIKNFAFPKSTIKLFALTEGIR